MPKRRRLTPYESVSNMINTVVEDLNNGTILKNDSLYIHGFIYSGLRNALNPTFNSEFIDITIK